MIGNCTVQQSSMRRQRINGEKKMGKNIAIPKIGR
jgi:hypothetical protein